MTPSLIIKPWIHFKVFLCCCIGLNAQNSSVQTFSSREIKGIVIKGNQIFQIDVSTYSGPEIQLFSKLEGEYQGDYKVTSKIHGELLIISLEKNPLSNILDNKRNAHKVIAASIELKVQSGLDFEIESDIGSVNLRGTYNRLAVKLNQGYCNVYGLANNAQIQTVDGNITLQIPKGKVNSQSRYGKVKAISLPDGSSTWNLRSIYGDINVSKQQE